MDASLWWPSTPSSLAHRCRWGRPTHHWKTTTFVAGLRLDGVVAPLVLDGPINATAPNPVTNAEFSHELARALRRPSWLTAPAFALRLALGELADTLLLNGQRVVPARATALGVRFTYAELRPALTALFEPR